MPKEKTSEPLDIEFLEDSDYKITSSAQLFNKKGNKNYLKGNFSRALRLYLKALKLTPNVGLIHYSPALSLLKLNKSSGEASKYFAMAIRRANGDKRILNLELSLKF